MQRSQELFASVFSIVKAPVGIRFARRASRYKTWIKSRYEHENGCYGGRYW